MAFDKNDITKEDAYAVLYDTERVGPTPGSFMQALVHAAFRADPVSLAKIAAGFPGIAAAVQQYKDEYGGRDFLLSLVSK